MSLCVYCISRLRFSDIGDMAEVDEQRVCIKFCVRLGKTGSETFEMLEQTFGGSCMSVAELLSGLDVSRMAELRLLIMIDQVGQARQQPPQKWNRYGLLSTRIVVVPYTISVQRLELVMDLVSEFSHNS